MESALIEVHVTDRAGREHRLQAELGQTLMQSLSLAGLVEGTCGGEASCATCHVVVAAADRTRLAPLTADESVLLPELLNAQDGSRLACQIRVLPEMHGLRMRVAQES